MLLCAAACSESPKVGCVSAGTGGAFASGGASSSGSGAAVGGTIATGGGSGSGSSAGMSGAVGTGGGSAGGGGTPSNDAGMGTAGGPGGAAQACGSRGLQPCPDGGYCDFPQSAQCGATDGGGQCKLRPQICPAIYAPVCGCDGTTHASACDAAGTGTSVASVGECGAGSSGGTSCDVTKVLCKIATPQCPADQVPSVAGTCYGPCVAIDQCACKSPTDCPMPNIYTCLGSAGHCSPFL